MKIYLPEKRTFGSIIKDKAEMHGERTFLLYKDEKYSFKELHEQSNKIANALIGRGVKKGDKVVTLLSNSPEYLFIWWGIAKTGAVHVPINNAYRGETLVDVVNRSDAEFAFVEAGISLNRFRKVVDKLMNLKEVAISHRLASSNPKKEEIDLALPSCTLSDLLASSANTPDVKVNFYDPVCIAYTSGTTGPPKGAVLPHEWCIHQAEQKAIHMRSTPEDVMYNCFPMHNLTGQIETCFAAFYADSKLVLADRFDPQGFWDDIKKYQVTETVSMGGLLGLLEKQPPREDDNKTTLKKVYAIPHPPDEHAFEMRFGVKLIEIYGQTEVGVVAFRNWDKPKIGSAGVADCGCEVKIFDDNDLECPPNTPGEIVVRPQKPHIIFAEYYKMPEKIASKMRNCWWHTGDLGKMDEDGNLYFIRRKEESVRVRGNFVSTTEIEKIVNMHPAILECAAGGVPDAEGQEEDLIVWVVLKPGSRITPEELARHCEKDVPYYMVPSYIRFMSELPKTPTMRVIKSELKKQGVTSDTWDRRKAGYRLSRE